MLHEHATLGFGAGSAFRILQLTDFHADVSEYDNERTRADVRCLVARHRPQLLAVTGDIWCADAHPSAAPMYLQRELDFLASLETPWAFTWGNHDYFGDFKTPMHWIGRAPHAVAPHGDGRGNFRIALERPDREFPLWEIFFLNSGLRWNLPWDLAWFEQEAQRLRQVRGRHVPAVAFFHIPLRNYQQAQDAGRVQGIANEPVLYWGDEEGLGSAILKRAGNLRACFCGHSHRNDYWFEDDGVIFGYGRCTGHGGYGGEDTPRGAKLIELPEDGGTPCFETVFANA